MILAEAAASGGTGTFTIVTGVIALGAAVVGAWAAYRQWRDAKAKANADMVQVGATMLENALARVNKENDSLRAHVDLLIEEVRMLKEQISHMIPRPPTT